jgi:hypothetical protein
VSTRPLLNFDPRYREICLLVAEWILLNANRVIVTKQTSRCNWSELLQLLSHAPSATGQEGQWINHMDYSPQNGARLVQNQKTMRLAVIVYAKNVKGGTFHASYC